MLQQKNKMIKKEMFNKNNSPEKIRINNLLSGIVKEDNAYKSGTAVVLDASDILTTRSLISAGYNRRMIDIVNFCEETVNKISKKHSNVFPMSLSEYIEMVKDVGQNNVSFAFFDYCCSVFNKDICPIEDLKKYFKYKLPAENSVLAVTFSFRGKKTSHYESVTVVDNVITEVASENGYFAIKDRRSIAYKGSMFVVIYKIKKCQSYINNYANHTTSRKKANKR